MGESILIKEFTEWGGLDLRSNAQNRDPRFSEDSINIIPTTNNSWSIRNGIKMKGPSAGGGGTKTYVYTDSNGARQEILLTVGSTLKKVVVSNVQVTYSNPGSGVFFIGPSDDPLAGNFVCRLIVDDVLIAEIDLGTGINEAVPFTLLDLNAAMGAFSGWALGVAGVGTTPAAALPNTYLNVPGAGLFLDYYYWTDVYCPTTNPFATFASKFSDDDFEIANLFNHNNLLFIATGYNKLYKFDSVSTFAAGMPEATSYSAVVTAGGAILQPNDFDMFITYEQIDALGKDVEGNASNIISLSTTGGNQQFTHTVPNILANSEYLTSCALANNGGTETNTTLTVDNGSGGAHTLQVGQTAYFYDNGGNEIERLITARTPTTITIQGAAVTIANNQVISANLRINIWRNRAGGSIPYLVKTLANNSFTASQTFLDNVADANLVIEYIEPLLGHDLPPENLRYLTAFQNLLLGAAPDTDEINFSDVDGPEYWTGAFTIRSKSNEQIRGIGSNKEVAAVFKSDETHIVTGNLATLNFRQELLSDGIGCDSHQSILDVDGTLWFYSGKHGVRRLISTGLTADLSYRILPAILPKGLFSNTEFKHQRTIAFDYEALQLAFYFIPSEESSPQYPNSSSLIFVADYSRQFDSDNQYDTAGRLERQIPKIRWFKWNSMNFAGGATIFDNNFIFTERRFNSPLAALEYPLSIYLENKDSTDYCDHASPIELIQDLGWVDVDEPDLLKKFIRAAIYSFPTILSGSFMVDCTLEIDFINDRAAAVKTLSYGNEVGASGWGSAPWGISAWPGGPQPRIVFPFKANRGRAMRLRFHSNSYLEAPIISGYDVQAVPVYGKDIKEDV